MIKCKGQGCPRYIDPLHKNTYPEYLWNTNTCRPECYSSLFRPGVPKEIPVTPEELAAGGTRADKGKPAMHLIPPEVLIELGKLYEIGAKKYSPHNWQRGMNYSRMYASTMRHLLKWWAGEERDPEDNQHHLDAVIWGAVGLRYFEIHRDIYEQFDDRFDPEKELVVPKAPYTSERIFIQADKEID